MEKKIRNLRKNLNEDDLLQQQSAFLKESEDPEFQPTVSKLYLRDESKRPKFDHQPSAASNNVFMPLNIVEHDTSNFTVNEIEKRMSESVKMDERLFKCDLTNFKATTNNSGDKKKSLFSQFMENKRQNLINQTDLTSGSSQLTQQVTTSSANKPRLIDGSGLHADNELAKKEIESIDKQNDELLNKLNDEERQQLMQQFNFSNLDPNLIKFIKSRKVDSSSKVQKDRVTFQLPKQDDVKEDEMKEDEMKNEKVESIPYVDSEEIKKHRWLNMDKVESEKLEWMKPLVENEEKRKVQSKGSIEGKAARFNFEGDLMVKEELDYRKGLHHHSEQDKASGYTINELIALSQSKYIPQRILSLNTLANIFRRMHRGYFDICFDKSLIIELLEQTEILILLRKLLDDSNVSLQLVTIKCIHSLVCNTIYDEYCLDRLFCSMELGIEVPKLCYTELTNEQELKDEQLCKLDVISCLIRMNILPRLRYLLDTLVLNNDTTTHPENADQMVIEHIMDILIRVCRHSARACNQLIETPYLLNNFITSKTRILNSKALKVIRILFTTDRSNITKIKKQFPGLWNVLANYLIMNPPNAEEKEFYSSIIEVLRVWRVLLILDNDSNETTDQFKCELAGNIRSCLRMRILTNNSFDLHYVSNLLHCLAYVIQKLSIEQKHHFEGFFTPLIQDLTFRWFREMQEDNQIPKLDGCLAVSSALLYLSWSSTSKEQLCENVLKPITTGLMNKLTDQLLAHSSILYFKEYHNSIYRDSKALPSYGSIYFGGNTIKLNQLVNENSMIFFVGPLVGLAAKHQLNESLEQFIYHPTIRDYLDRIVKQVNKSSANWTIFELIEFNFISQLILWERNVLNKSVYFDHALSIVGSVGDLQLKRSLSEYVLDPFNQLVLFQRTILNGIQGLDHVLEVLSLVGGSDAELRQSIGDSVLLDVKKYRQIFRSDQLVKSSIFFLNEIKKVYLTFSTFEDKNWIFEPLVKLYKMQLNANCQLTEDELVGYVSSCLNYLILLYNFNPSYLWSVTEPKILFVYLSSVFLFKNSLFLNDQLIKVLRYFLIVLTSNHKIYFDCYDETIPEPFNSIGDHFNALCINYRTDSYGDYVFSNYLLCFLTQASDKVFRKKLLDEHTACLNYFILNNNQLLISKDSLINPIEADLIIVESYIRILMAKDIIKQRNPLLYEIACTHVSKALFDERYHENRLEHSELVEKLIACLKLSNNRELKSDLNVM